MGKISIRSLSLEDAAPIFSWLTSFVFIETNFIYRAS